MRSSLRRGRIPRHPARVVWLSVTAAMLVALPTMAAASPALSSPGADPEGVAHAGSDLRRPAVVWTDERRAAAIPMPLGEVDDGARVAPYAENEAPFTRLLVRRFEVKRDPFKAVGKLFFLGTDGLSYSCSASVVNRDQVLTAGHCVHAGDGSGAAGWSSGFQFIPSFDGNLPCPGNGCPWGVWDDPHDVSVMNGWANEGSFNYDGGGIVFNPEPATGVWPGGSVGDVVGWLGWITEIDREQHWNTFGYPANIGDRTGDRLFWCMSSYAYPVDGGTIGPAMNGMGCDQGSGGSGGPVIFGFGKENQVNGLNSAHRTGFDDEVMSPYFGRAFTNLLTDLISCRPGTAC